MPLSHQLWGKLQQKAFLTDMIAIREARDRVEKRSQQCRWWTTPDGLSREMVQDVSKHRHSDAVFSAIITDHHKLFGHGVKGRAAYQVLIIWPGYEGLIYEGCHPVERHPVYQALSGNADTLDDAQALVDGLINELREIEPGEYVDRPRGGRA